MKDSLRKLKFNDTPIVINASTEIQSELTSIGFKTSFDKKQKATNALVFVANLKEFITFLKSEIKNIEDDAVLWFAYPKGTSKIKTDINRDILWQEAAAYNIRPVSIVSLNETWSVLRFRSIENVKSIKK